uniref:Hairy enhancer of split 5 n=1 Tax=Platynereis dumerilii TaxID=6359 RepID=S5TPZ2_PLADU|nr:hairy enhancer of split 5 [Platynereis dumerilii]
MAADLSDSGDECRSNLSASEMRKANKPLMEKRRRARINESLNMLKTLVLDALKRDTSRYSKLEKADILEMTVKHLRSVQRQQMSAAMATDSTVMEKYRNGYQECAGEVSRYLTSIDGLEPNVRNRLMNHLMGCVQKVNDVTAQTTAVNSYVTNVSYVTQNAQVQIPTQHSGQQAQFHQQQQSFESQHLMQPVQVQIPSSTQLISLPGTPLDGTTAVHVLQGNPQGHSMGNPMGNSSQPGNPPLLMVPGYSYSHPYPTPSPNSSRSSSPSVSSPPPGKDLNCNDITGVYVDQHDVMRRRMEESERKQRAFHPYRPRSASPSPKDYNSFNSNCQNSTKKMPLRPIVNQPIKSDNMWRPW